MRWKFDLMQVKGAGGGGGALRLQCFHVVGVHSALSQEKSKF